MALVWVVLATANIYASPSSAYEAEIACPYGSAFFHQSVPGWRHNPRLQADLWRQVSRFSITHRLFCSLKLSAARGG